jgi:hypothetical protein
MITVDSEQIFKFDDENCKKFVRGFRSHNQFVTKFLSKYKYIVAYHSTKLNDEEHDMIIKQGLIKSSRNLLVEKAKRRFVSTSDSPELQNDIGLFINDYLERYQHINLGEVNFVIDEELFECAYQYLLFGPELLLPLADELADKFSTSFRDKMLKFGNSAVVIAQIPVNIINPRWLAGIYEYLCKDYPDCCLVLKEDLPKEYIVDIKYVPTPHNRYRIPVY